MWLLLIQEEWGSTWPTMPKFGWCSCQTASKVLTILLIFAETQVPVMFIVREKKKKVTASKIFVYLQYNCDLNTNVVDENKLFDQLSITSPFLGLPLFFFTTCCPSTAILMGWVSANTFDTAVPASNKQYINNKNTTKRITFSQPTSCTQNNHIKRCWELLNCSNIIKQLDTTVYKIQNLLVPLYKLHVR